MGAIKLATVTSKTNRAEVTYALAESAKDTVDLRTAHPL